MLLAICQLQLVVVNSVISDATCYKSSYYTMLNSVFGTFL